MRGHPRIGALDHGPQHGRTQHGTDGAIWLPAQAQRRRHRRATRQVPGTVDVLDGRRALLLGEAEAIEVRLLPGDDVETPGSTRQPPGAGRAEAAVPVVDEDGYSSHGSSSRVRFSSKNPGVTASVLVASNRRTASSPRGTREMIGP